MGRIDRPALPSRPPPPAAVRAAQALRRGVGRVHDGMTLPVLRLLEQTTSLVEVRATAAFARLGVADVLGADRRTAIDLATVLDVDPDALDRLLRFLATVGVVDRDADAFALTAMGDLLRRDHPQSLRPWILFQGSAWQWHAWEELEAGITTPDTTPFHRAHGREFFDHLVAEPAAGATFDAAMEATSGLQAELLVAALDLDGIEHVCDVGGGTGTMLARLLQGRPGMRGTLFDLPEVVARAGPVLDVHGVADRVEVVGGDMFTAVPPGADRYLLSAIVHDWNDDRAVDLLRAVRAALGSDGRAWVVELELPDHDGARLERAYDLLMLVLGGGRERTRDDFASLYAAADLEHVDDTVLANGWHVHELARTP
ncbi:methyltransferase [Salsipaludibacter albus]|uniref:methyltransferase n=1 Tax=Salsipaludibacter albus TaxID=2849650 RepID=UPI001EE43A0F|nr:methyltransferase [Salsipaludibacter albus]MBY5163613.1 hydroxyneurosporene methyltransferase [Salsipaludibacter albus]